MVKKVVKNQTLTILGNPYKPNKGKYIVRTGKENAQQRLKKYNDGMDELDKLNQVGQLEGFPVKPVKAPLYHKDQKAFDKITYPLVTIIPTPALYGGIQEAVFKTYNGRKNCIRYFTKNKDLTDKQCEMLWADDDIRSVYGYEINNQKMTDRMFGSFIKWISIHAPKLEEEDIIDMKEYEAYKRTSPQLQPNPDGSRRPFVLQMGVNSYMKRNQLNNPTQIIEAHTKMEKLKIYDYENLGAILDECNITAQEAMNYVSAYLTKNRNIRRKHTEDRELTRGATALKLLIDHYKAEKKRTSILKIDKPKTKVYGYKELMGSKQYKDYCDKTGEPQLRQYESFKKWIKKRLNVLNKV